ncbi:MAG: CBS domain-containing protein [Gemmatimonadetes bacterium]|nr:CBS domain-containing protein [Gemmatimonadota bacterium]
MIVRELMSFPVFTIRADKTLRAVQEIMDWAHIRHVPVVDAEGRLVGILSHRDILGAAISSLAIRIAEAERRQDLAAKEVQSVMQKVVATISPDERVQRAAQLMKQHRIGCLPVVDQGKLVGMITEADLLDLVVGLSDEVVDG